MTCSAHFRRSLTQGSILKAFNDAPDAASDATPSRMGAGGASGSVVGATAAWGRGMRQIRIVRNGFANLGLPLYAVYGDISRYILGAVLWQK
jgi:hypothetical protein